MFQGSGVQSTLNNIQASIESSLRSKYGIEDLDKVHAILKTHGLHKSNFDFIENAENFLTAKPLNDISIDDNSNKNEKTVSGIMSEIAMPISKVVGYRYLYRTMRELYGPKEADRLSGLLYDFTLAMHDSTKILSPYCWAFDASKLVMDGRPYGQLKSGPPKRLHSYIGMLNETVHQFPLHIAGALAIATFFLDVAHILLYREGVTPEQIKSDPAIRKQITNSYQAFVHSVNHMSRSNSESPFSNISVFDRVKLRSLLADEGGMGWYFVGYEGDRKEEIVEIIVDLQNLFFEFFDKGDQAQNGLPYRFPVVTVNLSKHITKSGEIAISDPKFVKDFCKREIYRYNILVSEGTKTASCCRLLSDPEKMKMAAGSVNSFGGSAMSMGSHRVVTINFNRLALEATSYEDYLDRIRARSLDTLKILKAHRILLNKMEDAGLQPMFKNGWINKRNLFSTVGILGVYEANLTLTRKFGDLGVDFVHDTLDLLNKECMRLAAEAGGAVNLEQVPGEGLAPKLCAVDKMIFGEVASSYPLYSNQFVPLWVDATLYERMEIDGRYNKLLTGGGIVHLNLKSKVTPTQAEKLVTMSATLGAEHFSLNIMYSVCTAGHVTASNGGNCPLCCEPIKDRMTRVVGFFVPVSSMGQVRREWEMPRRIFKGNEV